MLYYPVPAMRIHNLLISLTFSMCATVTLLPSMAISQQTDSPNRVWDSVNDQKATDGIIFKRSQEILAYLNRSNSKLQSGDGEGALSELDTVINIYPQQYSALYAARGLIHYRLGNRTKAESDFNIATNLDAADKYVRRGDSKYNSGDKKGAILDYDQAININPKSFVAYISRGSAKYDSGDKKGAILDFDKAISIDSNHTSLYGLRGLAKYSLNDKEGAILDFSKVISINSNSFESYVNRGTAKYDLNDYKGAIADLDKAISINPEQRGSAYGIRGFAKYKINDKKGAINDLRIAAKLFKIEGDMGSHNDTINLIRLISN